MKSSILGFTLIFIIFSSLFFSYSNPTSLNTIAYGSSSLSLSSQNQKIIDKVTIKVTEAKLSANYISVKKVLERLALQTQNNGENVQESLNKILNQVSQNHESKVVDKIANLTLEESFSNTQQQPSNLQKPSNIQQNQVTPQSPNDFSNRDDTTVSDKALEIDPNNTDALDIKGTALFLLDKYDEAVQYFDKEPNHSQQKESILKRKWLLQDIVVGLVRKLLNLVHPAMVLYSLFQIQEISEEEQLEYHLMNSYS